MKPQEIEQLKSLYLQIRNSLTKEDFVTSFKNVVEHVLQAEKTLLARVMVGITDIQTSFKELASSLKESNAKNIAGLTARVDTALTDQQRGMNFIYDKVRSLKNGVDGVDGKDADEKQIVAEVLKQIPPQQLLDGEDIRNFLEALPVGEKLRIEAIEDLEKRLEELAKKAVSKTVLQGGFIGRDFIKDIDISAQFDGVTTTFNIPGTWNVISVNLSSYPYGSLRKNIDYTWTPTSITFTANIDPSTQLAAGQQCILTVVTA